MSKEWELGFAAGYRACYNEYSSYTAREADTMFSSPQFTREMAEERKEAKKKVKECATNFCSRNEGNICDSNFEIFAKDLIFS